MKRTLSFFWFLLFVVFFACKKDDVVESKVTNEEVTVNMNTAIQLRSGNYWIYRRILTNPDGSKYYTSIYDSIYIERDSVNSNGRKFFIRKGYAPDFEALYDSAGCIVRAADGKFWLKPEIVFSETNFRDTIYRTDQYYGMMHIDVNPIEVPAGKFKTLVFSVVPLGASHHGGHVTEQHYQNDFYANGVGLIRKAYNHFGVPVEHDLVRYKLK